MSLLREFVRGRVPQRAVGSGVIAVLRHASISRRTSSIDVKTQLLASAHAHPHLQALLPTQPSHAFAVDRPALAPQHHVILCYPKRGRACAISAMGKSVRTTEIYLKQLVPDTVRLNEQAIVASTK
ncbi:MAG: hypothetical protein ABI585_12760 [Betaproteobacteria bacterium]